MSADVLAAFSATFPPATPRPSLDHAAFDVPASELVAVLRHLRDVAGFDMLVDVTAIDGGLGATPRFTAVYHLLSTTHHTYVRIASAAVGDDEPTVPSIVSLWPAADWHERETYDMFGLRFVGHPDLRRILMWEGYPHFPLRKEFPLAGIDVPLPDEEVAAETGATVKPAPMMGGPFVAVPGEINLTEAEPRAKDESWNERREKPAS